MSRVRPPAQNHTKIILLALLILIILLIKFTSSKVSTTLDQRIQTSPPSQGESISPPQ